MNRYFRSATLFVFIALACVCRAQGSSAGASEVPLTVSDGGRINMVSGSSIILKPGVRVVAGGYLHAAIVSEPVEQKAGLRKTRKTKNTAEAEAASLPVIMEAQTGISPFPGKSGKSINETDSKGENLAAQITEGSGISPQQERKVTGYTVIKTNIPSGRITKTALYQLIPLSQTPQTISVLRL
jgi:hypothetical protein